LTTLRQATMQGLGRVVLGRVPETLLAPLLFLVLVGAGFPLLGHRFSAEWAMGLQVAAQIAAFATGVVLLRRALPAAVRDAAAAYETRAWLRSAVPLLLMSGLMALNAQLGTIFLGSMKGAAAAGVYAVATRVALFTSFFWLAATYPLMPAVARLHAQARSAELQRVLSRGAAVTALCSIPIALLLVTFGRQFLALFGHDFGGGIWALRILALGELGKVLTGFAGLALVMTGHERDLATGVAIGAGLNVALNATWIPVWGVDGAAVAGAVSVFASNLFLVYLVWRRLRVFSLPLPLPPFARSSPR
jgi:O-antigen/teichoic acid export membrane protein